MHAKWDTIRPVPTELAVVAMKSHHRGYILALEDIQGDINTMVRSGNFSLARIRDKIQESLEQAQFSQNLLRKETDGDL